MKSKDKGYLGESIVKLDYIGGGYKFLDSNYTIRGGELDLIFRKGEILVFVEVKVVDEIDDYSGYITKSKLKSLQKTIDTYIHTCDFMGDYRLDVVFVKNGKIDLKLEGIEI